MQQLMLPMLPEGATYINERLSVNCQDNEWVYFLSITPVYSHRADNKKLFRLHTSQLIDSGVCRSIEIIKTFGVSKSSVMRALRQYREKGAESFFEPRITRKGGPILNDEVLERAQDSLDQGIEPKEIAKNCDVKADTLRKAIKDGRLKKKK